MIVTNVTPSAQRPPRSPVFPHPRPVALVLLGALMSAHAALAQAPLQSSIAGLEVPPGSPPPPESKVHPASVNADGTVVAYLSLGDAICDLWPDLYRLDLNPDAGQDARERLTCGANVRAAGLDASGDLVAYALPLEEPGGTAFQVVRRDLTTDDPPIVLACYAAGEIDDVQNLHLSPDGSSAVYQALSGGKSVIHRTTGTGVDCDVSPPPLPLVLPFPCCVGAGGQMFLAASGRAWTKDSSTIVFSTASGLPAKPVHRIFSHDGSTLTALSCPNPLAGEQDFAPTLDASEPEQVYWLRETGNSTSLLRASIASGCSGTTTLLGPLVGADISDPAVSLDGGSVVFVSDHDPLGGHDVWELNTLTGVASNRTFEAMEAAPTAPHAVRQGELCYYGRTEPNDLRAVNLSRAQPWVTTTQGFPAPPLSCLSEVVDPGFPVLPSTRVACDAQLDNGAPRSRTVLAFHDIRLDDGLSLSHGPVLTIIGIGEELTLQSSLLTTCEPVQGYTASAGCIEASMLDEDLVGSTVVGVTLDGSAWCAP
ncbi:MAG: hypothetical protein AAF533_11820 [Acidobacteriota bacterium]